MLTPSTPGRSGPPQVLHASTAELVTLATTMITPGERRLLGITGAPGAGKSTLCAALAEALGDHAAVVGMDGFHLANRELDRLGRRDRKGAPDTFDAAGYVALLWRLRRQTSVTVYAPEFHRDLEESLCGAVPIFPGTPLVITEGNYLLLDDGPWREVRAALDVTWFLDLPGDVRVRRLVARHETYGKTPEDAQLWAEHVDERNAELINATRDHADLVIHLND